MVINIMMNKKMKEENEKALAVKAFVDEWTGRGYDKERGKMYYTLYFDKEK